MWSYGFYDFKVGRLERRCKVRLMWDCGYGIVFYSCIEVRWNEGFGYVVLQRRLVWYV